MRSDYCVCGRCRLRTDWDEPREGATLAGVLHTQQGCPPDAQQIPVDRSQRVLVSGKPVPEDGSHTELKDNGQQKDYVVLSASERSKGFVRPYRDAYRHLKCGKITTMSRSIAETYARDPHFYTGTFCTTCGSHFPIGETGEFTWYEMDGSSGTKVGT